MRSEAQREASRVNGARSRGPRSPEGKEVTRFNGLKHGLRAEQVVLPGEDPAEFEAERRGWLDDWAPASHTRAVLVERAAVASWRLRRAVRAEAALRRKRADEAARDFDADRLARVDRAIGRFDDAPAAALTLLEADATGLDRLLTSWGELAGALADGPGGWDRPRYHARLLLLLGHPADADPASAGPMPLASARLLDADLPPSVAEAEAAAEGLRRLVAEAIGRLQELRRQAPDPDRLRRRAVDAATADASAEAQLRHRYEMALDRSLRATINQLLALNRTDADLPDPSEARPGPGESETVAPAAPAESEAPPPEPAPPPAASPPEPTAPGSLGARDPGPIPTRDASPDRGPRPPARPASAAVGA